MGSYNVSCALTNLPICEGEEVKLAFLVDNPSKALNASSFYKLLIPVFLDATYNDYGRFVFNDDQISDDVLQLFKEDCMIGCRNDQKGFNTFVTITDVFDYINKSVVFVPPSQFDVAYCNTYTFENTSMEYYAAHPRRVHYMAIKKTVMDDLCSCDVVKDEPEYRNNSVVYRDFKLLELLDCYMPYRGISERLKKHIVVSGIINEKQCSSVIDSKCRDDIRQKFREELEMGEKRGLLELYMFKIPNLERREDGSYNITDDDLDNVRVYESILDQYELDINNIFELVTIDNLLRTSSFSGLYNNISKHTVIQFAYKSVENAKLLSVYGMYLYTYLHKCFMPSLYAGQETDTAPHQIFSEIMQRVIEKQNIDDEEF